MYEETLQFKRKIQILKKTPHRGHKLATHQRRTIDIPFKIYREIEREKIEIENHIKYRYTSLLSSRNEKQNETLSISN